MCHDTLPCVQHSILYLYLILIISNNTIISFHIVFSRAISRSHHTPEVDIRFQIDGDNVCGSSTFSQLGVENGGIISWVLGQHGGSDTAVDNEIDTLVPCEVKRRFVLKLVDVYNEALKMRDGIEVELDNLEAEKEREMGKADSSVKKEAGVKFGSILRQTHDLYQRRKNSLVQSAAEGLELRRSLDDDTEPVGEDPGVAEALRELESGREKARLNVLLCEERYVIKECGNKRQRISEKFDPSISDKKLELEQYQNMVDYNMSAITFHLPKDVDIEQAMSALQQQVRIDLYFIFFFVLVILPSNVICFCITNSQLKEHGNTIVAAPETPNKQQGESAEQEVPSAAAANAGANAEEPEESQLQSQPLLSQTQTQNVEGINSNQVT